MLFLWLLLPFIHIQLTCGQWTQQAFERNLQGFFQMTSKYKLTPTVTSNYASGPISGKMVDRTEYSINRRILSKVFESDMVLTKPQMDDVIDNFRARVTGVKRAKRQAVKDENLRWPNGTIPYEFKGNDTEWQNTIRRAMYSWSKLTCVRFVPHTWQKDYAVYFRGGGCYSSVGRIGGRQYISIGYGCESKGIVAHEIGHALGFWHEQSRPDRDRYINLNEDHIAKGAKGNFELRNDVMNGDIPYDFGSVMHYGPQAFTDNWSFATIETKDHRFQHTIGQRAGIAFTDVKFANRLYCNHICKHDLQCLNGGYEDPLNCNRCRCPPPLGGTRCERIEKSDHVDCGGELIATPMWQVLTNSRVGKCYWRITAPNNGRVAFEIIETKFKCDSSCAYSHLEIKHSETIEQTGFRQCCNPVPGRIISQGSQVMISSISEQAPSNFTMRFILESDNIPPPPPAEWKGNGGLTGLLGANEIGIDNTFENVVLKELPRALSHSRGGNNFGSFFGILDSFLKSG